MTDKAKFLRMFGKSTNNNFRVIDSIGVPHPYCIDSVHLQYNKSMMLGSEQIIEMEREHPDKVMCDICKKRHKKFGDKILSYEEHEQALLVECKADMTEGKPDKDGKVKTNPELHDFLLKNKDKATKKKFAGFAFLDMRDKK